MNKIKTLKANSIVEILLYVAIVSIFVISIISVIFNLIDSNSKRQAIEKVNLEAQSIILFFQKEMRSANSIVSPTINQSGTTLKIISDNNSEREIIIVDGNIYIKVDGGAQVQINSSKVNLIDAQFINASNDNTTGSILFRFNLKFNTQESLQSFNYSQNYETSFTIKRYVSD
mgnify:FL=1